MPFSSILEGWCMKMRAPIHIWDEKSVPDDLWRLIEDQDDISWVALVKKKKGDPFWDVPLFMSEGSSFAPCTMTVVELENHYLIVAYHS